MHLDAANNKFYSFILYFILFKKRLLEKHFYIVVFVKLKMFREEDNNKQDVLIIGSSITKGNFFLNIEVANFLTFQGFFAYNCLFQCSEYEYLNNGMNFIFSISFLFSR